jgi:outer membrane protein
MVALVVALAATPALARQNDALANGDTRVAIVHFADVVESSPAFAEASARWSERLAGLTADIQALQDEFAADEQRLTTSIPPLQGAERTALVASMERLRAEIERRRAEVEPDLNAMRQSLLLPVVEAARGATEEYARAQGFDVVIDSSSPLIGFVLAAASVDLTDEVIVALGGATPAPDDSSTAPPIPLLPENVPVPGVPELGEPAVPAGQDP